VIQQTSIEAYETIKKDLGKCQKLVCEVIRDNPSCSNRDIKNILGWEINRVTGRVKELRDYGYVSIKGTKIDKDTNMKVMIYEYNGGLI